MYCGTPTFWQRGLWDSCFQNPSESSEKPADLYLHCLQEKPADQDPYYLLELISDFFILFSKEHERYKLISSFGQVKFSMNKYIMAINLYLDK